ncbi:MAG TPA: orotidine-5'-phosphate decarboxylase [Actinobacteria bacterium]|nr:orotidine-5'-phosphate decarboxylase [Actinomycetota bacterium]
MTSTSSPSSPATSGVAPVAVAMDAPSLTVMAEWARAVAPVVSTLKVGLEVFCRDGAAAVTAARQAADEAGHPGIDVFLDLKLHDIPATVRGAASAVSGLDPTFLTVHATGGTAMITAAAEALPATRITAVTVLTSLSEEDLARIGLLGPSREAVVRLATLAVEAGARAIVCSPQEVAAVRSVVPADVTLITPGVRPAGAALDDQQRVATPEQALADGADLLVIGRPITGADDPRAAALAVARSLVTR